MARTTGPAGRSVASKLAAILDVFAEERLNLTLSEFAQRAELPISTVSRLLVEMTTAGWLERRPTDGSFQVGMRLWEVGALAPRKRSLRGAAIPYPRTRMRPCTRMSNSSSLMPRTVSASSGSTGSMRCRSGRTSEAVCRSTPRRQGSRCSRTLPRRSGRACSRGRSSGSRTPRSLTPLVCRRCSSVSGRRVSRYPEGSAAVISARSLHQSTDAMAGFSVQWGLSRTSGSISIVWVRPCGRSRWRSDAHPASVSDRRIARPVSAHLCCCEGGVARPAARGERLPSGRSRNAQRRTAERCLG